MSRIDWGPVLFVLLAIALLTVSLDPRPSTPHGDRGVSGNGDTVEYVTNTPTRPATATVAPPTASATATATHIPLPATLAPAVDAFDGWVTHYGESFNGQSMGCGGTYRSEDPGIVAVAYPGRNTEWPCGTVFRIIGPAGVLVAPRTDSCPGCGLSQFDLSEAGSAIVCGRVGNCNVRIEVLR